MEVLVPGHKYKLQNFDDPDQNQVIDFIHKSPIPTHPSELVLVSDGTTNEEVIEMLIDRMKYLQNLFPCKENACAITKLEEALMWLEKRTADRKKRGVEGKHEA